MTQTVEVEIDETGRVQAKDARTPLPRGRAYLVWETDSANECALMSEAALAVDWLRPEEDEAWAYMQPDK